MVLQAWFDESGKTEEPVYLLAGYVGKKTVWEDFAHDWQAELDHEPKLPYLHARESQLFKGTDADARVERLLKFVAIIRKHRLRGVSFLLKHSDYREFFRIISVHPVITPAERRMMRNPYYLSFQYIFTMMLIRHGQKCAESGTKELLEILFDDGGERKQRLKIGFENFVKTAKEKNPHLLDLLINKGPEFRDDKQMSPLQACDLFAWHFRRFCYEASRGNKYEDAIWRALRDGIEYDTYLFTESDWIKLLLRLRQSTWDELLKHKSEDNP
ncbi:MAG: DUF3800 domain-containing protein [Candidatus Binatus sp.]|nr:DUF3800 domain-containing protein [Candidatus Binatus sp.]